MEPEKIEIPEGHLNVLLRVLAHLRKEHSEDIKPHMEKDIEEFVEDASKHTDGILTLSTVGSMRCFGVLCELTQKIIEDKEEGKDN